MPRLVTLGVALAMFLPVAGSAPNPKGEDKPVLYLPTTVGDKLVFEFRESGKTHEREKWVTAVEQKDGMTVVSFAYREGGPVEDREGVTLDGVFWVSTGEFTCKPPKQVLKLPGKAGGNLGMDARRRELVVSQDQAHDRQGGRGGGPGG
jgi:hypothetical protein